MNADMERLCRAAGIADLRHDLWQDPLPEDLIGDRAESLDHIVRAVLAELRNPSDRMMEAAAEVYSEWYDGPNPVENAAELQVKSFEAYLDSITEAE